MARTFRRVATWSKETPVSKIVIALAAVLLLTGNAAAQTGSVEVKNAWARATPAKAENGAAYVTLESRDVPTA